LEEKVKDFFLNWKYVSKQISKLIKNRLFYTKCMNSHEDTLGIFRICRSDEKAVKCYTQLDGKEVRKIKVKNKVYTLCPTAPKFYDEKDCEKYKT
jgi:hypothetical protein